MAKGRRLTVKRFLKASGLVVLYLVILLLVVPVIRDNFSIIITTKRATTEMMTIPQKLVFNYRTNYSSTSTDELPKSEKNPTTEFVIWQTKDPGKWSYPKAKKSLIKRLNMHNASLTTWKRFQNHISKDRLYDPKDSTVDKLINELQKQPIVSLKELSTGTQLKLIIRMKSGAKAIFKPMRFSREQARTGENQFYFNDMERHNAEIAAYHLDRVLGFNRVPPTVGRVINITKEIKPFADKKFNETIFTSPTGKTCFFGTCSMYCLGGLAFCGKPDVIEGSLQVMVPTFEEAPRESIRPPWARSYSFHAKANWQKDRHYCKGLVPKLSQSRYLLDVIDTAIFDFMTGNEDRHHLFMYKAFGNESAPYLIDNGRGFGSPSKDELDNLAALTQCCLIRHSTLLKLLRFVGTSESLSAAFIESSSQDLVHPLLTDDFYTAIDRRLTTILNELKKCLKHERFHKVVIDDGY